MIKKINYLKLGQTLDKLYQLCDLLPDIKISKINRKGFLTLSERKGISFWRFKTKRIVKKHISDLLYEDILNILVIKHFGTLGEDILDFYKEQLINKASYSEDELSNIKFTIDTLFDEWQNRTLSRFSKKKFPSIVIEPISKEEFDDTSEDTVGKTVHLFDLIPLFSRAKLRTNAKKTLISTYLSALLSFRSTTFVQLSKFVQNSAFIRQLRLRDPPLQMVIINNSS